MRELLKENINSLCFVLGLSLGCVGIWQLWSWAWAAIFAGVILMLASVFPYVTMAYKQ